MAQYIYTMNRVSKVVPPKRIILRDISLSFFPGAKIGVLGLNGSGKSSLLKIMGGIDTNFDGEARPQSGIRIGFLPQEPQLDAALDVRTTVMEGVGETFRQLAEWILELDRGYGIPWHGNYSSWLEQKEQRLALEEREREALRKTLAHELEWVRQNPKARQAKSKARLQRYEELASREFQERNETNEIYIPPGERLGDLVIAVSGLRKGYGDRLLIDELAFSLPRGGIVGIIGPNGAGKTTLFRMLIGAEKPDAGEIRLGASVRLGYVDQSRQSLDDRKTVWQEISGGLDTIKVGAYETPSRAYVGRFNFRGTQQQQLIGELSGGERNRVHLAKVLRSGGNVLLLDEPTNDLDIETLRALEEALLSFPGCAVVISHDRWFLDRIATHILAFEGDSQVMWFEGNYQEYVEDYRRRRGEDAAQPHRIRYKPLTR